MKISTGFYVLLGLLIPSVGLNFVMRERLATAAAASAQAQARAAEANALASLERARAEAAQQNAANSVFKFEGLPTPRFDTPVFRVPTGPTNAPCCSTLELDAKQIQTMSEKCAVACETAETTSAEAQVVVAQLELCLAAPVVDRDRIHTLLDQLFVLRRKELESKVDAILTVRDTLTHEQIEKLKKMVRGEE